MTHYAQHVYTVTYVTAPRGASCRIAHQDPWVQDELHSDLTYWGHDPRWWIYVDTPDPMDRGISGDETLIPWIPGSGVLSQEALILRMSHPCAIRHSLLVALPRLLIYDGARRVNGCLAGTHPTDESSCAIRHSFSWDTPQAPAGARRVNGCPAGTPRPTGSESHRSWQPILWMSHHTRTPCIQGLGPRIRGPGQSLETEVSRFGTPRG